MRLTSVETTPNPNSMKLNLDVSVGKALTYTKDQRSDCPVFVENLLDIAGVKSVFVCEKFITLNRDPRADWKPILEAAASMLTGEVADKITTDELRKTGEKLGQVHVLVQTFRGVPMQVKVVDSEHEHRIALSQRFTDAARFIQERDGSDFLKERYWADWGVRYGTAEEIALEVADEIEGTMDNSILERLKGASGVADRPGSVSLDTVKDDLKNHDWHIRLRAIQELGATEEAVSMLAEALQDPQPQVRRLAAAALGATGSPDAIVSLCHALTNDASVAVRRTAGDALCDLGAASAQPAMCLALSDANKLVRWRAAKFLTDLGTKEALPSLERARNDSEFEVHLEIEAAIQRIHGGLEGSTPAWKRILDELR
jgi:hypothetical protein